MTQEQINIIADRISDKLIKIVKEQLGIDQPVNPELLQVMQDAEKSKEEDLKAVKEGIGEGEAGREKDMTYFDNWHRWLSENGYTYDGEYYYDEDNNYFTPEQLWAKFK